MTDRDKRDYYRLSDTILVEFESVSRKDITDAQPADFFTSAPNFHLLRELYELQMESTQLVRAIANRDKELSQFLKNLDQRVGLIAKATATKDVKDAQLTACDVEISEGGLSFISERVLESDSYLAIRMLFQPSLLGLTAFCQVKHCQLQEDGYRIGVQFLDHDLQTQRLISRHIISKQSEQRRARLNQS